MQIYLRGIYYYKEQGYDSQQAPAVLFAGLWWIIVVPAIPHRLWGGGGGGGGGRQWLQMIGALENGKFAKCDKTIVSLLSLMLQQRE